MFNNRELAFKVEKLDSNENIISEQSYALTDGKVSVGDGGTRRKCSFNLLESLPEDYQAYKWKLYYGYRDFESNQFIYYPQGVFILVNPEEKEENQGRVTSYQGVDKTKLFEDYEFDEPIFYPSGTDIKVIIKDIAALFGQTQFNLGTYLGTLGVDFTFEEGSTAKQLLNTLVSSFSCEWFFDANGILVARKQVDPKEKAVKYKMDDIDTPLYITSTQTIDESNYYNRVILVGGKVDTPMYRAVVQDDAAIARAGGRIVQRYYTRDAAVTQSQVDGLAAYYLSTGVSLPAELKLTSLVLPDLEKGDVIEKNGRKYEIRSFDVPLGTGEQSISAGEIL
jgi:hypothetical protein